MLHGMNLQKQIDEARHALEELTKDEAELSRLETEQLLEIDGLKDSGSKDFAALATLEGKRAALASMLAEQRQAIRQARDEVARLEAAKVRGEALEDMRARCEQLENRRAEVNILLTELRSFMRDHLARIQQTRQVWECELETARDMVAQLYTLPSYQQARWGQDDPMTKAWRAAMEDVSPIAARALGLSPIGDYLNPVVYPFQGLEGVVVSTENALKAFDELGDQRGQEPASPVTYYLIRGQK